MKKILSIIAISLLALTGADAQSDETYYSGRDDAYAYNSYDNDYNNSYSSSTQDYTYETFYTELAPYGQWVSYPGYGNVWVPSNMDEDFSPYLTGGHWVYSDYGWTWVSDYRWGWAAFHYGRWFHDVSFGWMWVPGNEWAPAWVTWGSYNNNYCWAPIAPGYGFSTYYRPDAHCWNFVSCGHITQPYLSRYVVNHTVNVVNINTNITVINNVNTYNHVKYACGPRVNDVERVSGHRVERVNVVNASRPSDSRMNGNDLRIYRPAINSVATHTGGSRPMQSMSNMRTGENTMQRPESYRSASNYSSARADVQPMNNVKSNNRVEPYERSYERSGYQPQNMSRPSYQTQPVQRAESQPVQRFENRPTQKFSQPQEMSRPAYQSPQVQRIENRSMPQQGVQPQADSRPGYQSAPVQRVETRPAYQSQPVQRTESRPTYQSQPVQRIENRATIQQSAPQSGFSRPSFQSQAAHQAESRPSAQFAHEARGFRSH